MKRHGNLFEKIAKFENLILAVKRAIRGKRSKMTVTSFYFNMEKEVIRLERELNAGTYRPGSFRQFKIYEPKVRKICASQLVDRVVHHAICNIVEPIFEKRLISDSYACRRGFGMHSAVRRGQHFARRYSYYLKCDIQKYFESVDHQILRALLRRIFKDQKLLILLDLILAHQPEGAVPGKGIPIGNLTSQHFANFYLGELDHYLKERCGVRGYVRYMDDFICFADRKEDLHELLSKIRGFLDLQLKLSLKEKVVKIAPIEEGVPFLGFRIFRRTIRLQRENLVRLRQNIKKREVQYCRGIIDESLLVDSVGSMVAHIAHADSTQLRRRDFRKSNRMA